MALGVGRQLTPENFPSKCSFCTGISAEGSKLAKRGMEAQVKPLKQKSPTTGTGSWVIWYMAADGLHVYKRSADWKLPFFKKIKDLHSLPSALLL